MTCLLCEDEGWVCEDRRDKPWHNREGGCTCGAGDPCPGCNELAGPEIRDQIPAGDGSPHPQ